MTDDAEDGRPRYRPLSDSPPTSPADLQRRTDSPRRVRLEPGSDVTLSWEQGVIVARALHVCARHHGGAEAAAAMRALPLDVLGHALEDYDYDINDADDAANDDNNDAGDNDNSANDDSANDDDDDGKVGATDG